MWAFRKGVLKGTLSMFFSRPLLERNYMYGSISIEIKSFSKQCDIKTTNAKSVTDASIWVVFISKKATRLK